jgi:hypothetical protein
MKKLLVCLLVFICGLSLFSTQETYNINDYEVRAYKSLRRLSKDNQVEPTYPVSGEQLVSLLSKLSKESFSEPELRLYQDLLDKLDNVMKNADFCNGFTAVDARISFQPELYLRTGKDLVSYDQLIDKLPDRGTAYKLGGTIWLGENFAGFCDMDLKRPFDQEDWSKGLCWSIKGLDHDEHNPYEAWVSVGGGIYNLQLGRDRLSAGNGKTGNLFISDNFYFTDYAKASVAGDVISYDMTLMTFNKETANGQLSYPGFNSESSLIANHRLTASIFNFLAFSLYEGVLEYGTNMLESLSLLNPFMELHNTGSFAPGNNNNLFGVEVSAILAKGLELNFQVMFDQIQGLNEIEDNKEEAGLPANAGAALLNITYSECLKKGILDSYLEAVYASPVCYLKEDNPRGSSYHWWQTDLLLGSRLDDFLYYQYLGYPLGPNTIAIGLGTEYLDSRTRLGLELLYSVTGTYRKHDCMEIDWKYFYEWLPLCIGEDKVLQHEFRARLSFNTELCSGIKLKAILGYIGDLNYRNAEGETFNDLQATVGFTIEALELLKLAARE